MRRITAQLAFGLVAALLMTLPPALAAAPQPNGGWDAAWSPDGARIAFTSSSPHAIPNLWVIGADRKGLRQLTARGAHDPVWLPDGNTIVFGTVRAGQSTYMAIDARGEAGSEKPVDALPVGAEGPVWSPDGSLVAFGLVNQDGSARDLKFARTADGVPTGLTSRFWCREWVFSPDGSRLAFIVGKSIGTSIWTVDVSSGQMDLLYKGWCSALAWAPDGKSLAFAVPDVNSAFHISVVDLATRKERAITVRSFNGQKLLWSPDSRHLYWVSSRKSESAVWTVGADGAGLTRLTPVGSPSYAPSLSPDGARFVCQATPSGAFGPELWVAAITGKHRKKLVGGSSPSFWAPVWSPDGKRLAVQADVNRGPEVFIASPSGRLGRRRASVEGTAVGDVSWSADGKVVLAGGGGQLQIIDASRPNRPATPFPRLTSAVDGARIVKDEAIGTEWGSRNAHIVALKLDGSGRRDLTQRPEDAPAEPTAPDGPAAPATRASSTGNGLFRLASDAGPEEGNPHAGLGVVGPQKNVGPDRPAVIDLWPSVSPDGKDIAFVRGGQVWIAGVNGGAERVLTSLPSMEKGTRQLAGPSWSPDGRAVLFSSFSAADGAARFEIWRSVVAQGSQTLIHSEDVNTEYGVYQADCTWNPVLAPDGGRVLFTSLAGIEPRIASVAVDGGDFQTLVPAPSSFPALTADGTKLAYVDLSNNLERLRILDLATGKTTGPLFRG